MKIGDLVRMTPKKQHPLWQSGSWKGQADPWLGAIGIITSQYPSPDEELFVMMTHDPSKRSLEEIVIQKKDAEVISEKTLNKTHII